MSALTNKKTAKDFASDQEVRWCPGCGDYAVLHALRNVLAEKNIDPDNTVFVSGIGCSSRLPYYMKTYGFHTIHGRAPAIAGGIKLANPNLDVWVVSGDGDGMSIGGNHILHTLRRNVDLQILLFNNEIYGLTKGQASPTSTLGLRTPSTPFGSVDMPLTPCAVALGAGARFVARSADSLQKQLSGLLKAAHDFKGASFVEILQNCVIYNDGVFDAVTNTHTNADTTLIVEHGQPMIFGTDRNKGLCLKPGEITPEVVILGENGIAETDLLVHDEKNLYLAFLLSHLHGPEFPTVLGIFYRNVAPTYNDLVTDQITPVPQECRINPMAIRKDIESLLKAGRTWTVE